MVYQFMREHKNHYSIREMAVIFGVSSSAYYQWAKRGVSTRRSKRDAELLDLIREIVQTASWAVWESAGAGSVGQVKGNQGFRRFLLRGTAKVSTEWGLLALGYNLKQMYRINNQKPA
jgi:hypothetical protein